MKLRVLLAFAGLAIAIVIWSVIGATNLLTVSCLNFVGISLIVSALSGTALALLFMVRKMSGGGGLLIGVALILVISIGGTFVLSATLGETSVVKSMFCNSCGALDEVSSQLNEIELSGDVESQRDSYRKIEAKIDAFIDDALKIESKLPEQAKKSGYAKSCVASGQVVKARMLLSKLTNVSIPELRKFEPKSQQEAKNCLAIVSESYLVLDEAEKYISSNNGVGELNQLSKSHRETLTELASKCATPDDKSITVIETRKNPPDFEIDAKVIDGNGTFVPGLEDQIEVWANGELLEAKVMQITGGEPLCLTVVADNSASITDPNVNPDGKKNLQYIAQALTTLNDLRKPDDYYGLITFGGPNEINMVRNLDKSGVPTDKVDAKGGNTAIWDAVKVGIEQLADCRYPKRMLLLLTDGEDNSSVFMKKTPKTPPADIVKALNGLANQNSIFLNVLAIGPAVKNPDLKSFDTSDGAFVELNDFAGLSKKVSEVVGAQENFYRLIIDLDELEGVKLLKLKLKGGSSEVAVEVK